MKARYPSYMKHSRIWKYILLGLLAAVLVPFGLFAYGNYMTTYYNGLDYPWRYPDTVWRSEEPHAEIAVDGDERATLHLHFTGWAMVYIYIVQRPQEKIQRPACLFVVSTRHPRMFCA